MSHKPGRNFGAPHRPYDAEATAFLRAMGALRRRLGRMPTPAEVLREARRLGYRRQG